MVARLIKSLKLFLVVIGGNLWLSVIEVFFLYISVFLHDFIYDVAVAHGLKATGGIRKIGVCARVVEAVEGSEYAAGRSGE